MSLVHLANVCSHLQNSSRARLGLTSIPNTNMLLALALQLQASGFLASVTRAGPTPPASLISPTAFPHATDPAALDPLHPDSAHVTLANVASRRLWLGLKYWRERPVLEVMRMESKPKLRKWVGFRDLEIIVRGRDAKWTKGLTRTGECLYVSTDLGVLEARECVEKKMGGMLLCRAY